MIFLVTRMTQHTKRRAESSMLTRNIITNRTLSSSSRCYYVTTNDASFKEVVASDTAIVVMPNIADRQ